MTLGSTQPVVKMSIRNIPGGEGGRCMRLTTSPTSCAECHEIWEPKPPGTLWAIPGLLRDSFIFLHEGVKLKLDSFSSSAQEGRKRSALRPGHFNAGQRSRYL